MAISYIGFDCGNVLVQFDTERFYSFIRRHRGNSLEPQELFSGSKKQITIDYDLGRLTDEEYFESVKDAFKMDGLKPDLFFYLLGSIIIVDYAMLEIRDNFRKKGVKTFIVSNMNHFHLNYLRKSHPEVVSGFDFSMISCEEGIDKPNQEAWLRSFNKYGIKGEDCIFIDDVVKNIEVACSLGIKGWHFNVKDSKFISNGKLIDERKKLRNFLEFLWREGILSST